MSEQTTKPAPGRRDDRGDVSALERNLIERVSVGDIATRAAAQHGDRPALIDGARSLSFRALNEQANRLGAALRGMGLGAGDVVAVMARNCTEMMITYFACAKTGLVCAPVNLGLKGPEIVYCLHDAGARVLIAASDLAAAVAPLPGALPALQRIYWIGADVPDIAKSAGSFEDLLQAGTPQEFETIIHDRDPVQLLYTSGTTAQPKGVLTSHLAVTITALSAALTGAMNRHSTSLALLPLFHCAQLNADVIPLLSVGGTVVLMPGFDVGLVPRLIARHRVSHILLLPMMYAALLQSPDIQNHDLSSVRLARYAMAPMPQERLQAIHALFPNADVMLGSGQTEFTPPTTFQLPSHQLSKAASWGPATVMVQTAIMDEEGRLLPRGEIGELVYRGPQVMNGYLNQPEATAVSFRHGWFHSGDVAWIDGEGVIWFTDRKKDMIKSGGENVASIEVERCLMEHPGVAEAAVVGLPHEYWGEAVAAVVILQPGRQVSEQNLLAHCRERLASFKVPKAIRLVEQFPRTATGKIQKHVLRNELRDVFASSMES